MAGTSTAGSRAAWNTHCAPPPVRSRMAATGSSADASMVWVAPLPRASSRRRASRSTAMIGWAPEIRHSAVVSWPTTPWPKTATDSSICSSARRMPSSATSPSTAKVACSSLSSEASCSMDCTDERSSDSPDCAVSQWLPWLPNASTRSSTRNASTPGPQACTVPTSVYPRGRRSPRAASRAVFSLPALTWLRETRTSTWPGPGSGTSNDSVSTWPATATRRRPCISRTAGWGGSSAPGPAASLPGSRRTAGTPRR